MGYPVKKVLQNILRRVPSESYSPNRPPLLPHSFTTEVTLVLTGDWSLLQNIVGADRVIAWNSVCRKNTVDTDLKTVTKQQAPEKGFIPTTRLQPVAGIAHVDQNAVSDSLELAS